MKILQRSVTIRRNINHMNIKKKKHILVVDDESNVASALDDALSAEGFFVHTASDGKAALEYALKEHPDLILLDHAMPIMSGIEMLRELRMDSWGKNAKVILLTNIDETEVLSQAIRHNVRDYLIKTEWEITDVVSKVKAKL